VPINYPISLPAAAAPRILSFRAEGNTSITQSPYDGGSQQAQKFPPAPMVAEVQFPPMDRGPAEDLIAALLSCHYDAGCFYLGDSAGKNPRGLISGTPKLNGNVQGPNLIFLKNLANNTLVLKRGDWLRTGWGLNATRITTSGGTNVRKYFYDTTVHPSVNGQKYVASVRMANLGANTVRVTTNVAAVQDVLAGTEVQVSAVVTGDGAANLQFTFDALAAGNALDFIVWAPRLQRLGLDENFIPSANLDFTGWTAFSGASVTLAQNYNQRLYKVREDVTSDGAGLAAVDIYPSWRQPGIDAVADGDLIGYTNCQGIFRLQDDLVPWTIDEAVKYGIQMKCSEVF
jgi:hypothetical protein